MSFICCRLLLILFERYPYPEGSLSNVVTISSVILTLSQSINSLTALLGKSFVSRPRGARQHEGSQCCVCVWRYLCVCVSVCIWCILHVFVDYMIRNIQYSIREFACFGDSVTMSVIIHQLGFVMLKVYTACVSLICRNNYHSLQNKCCILGSFQSAIFV